MLAHQIKVHKSTDTKTWLIEIYGDRDNGGDPSALKVGQLGASSLYWLVTTDAPTWF